MGCGCTKNASTSSIQKVTTDHLHPINPQLQRSATDDHRGDVNLFTRESVTRFTRKSEYVDFFEREASRPQRNRDMLELYSQAGVYSLDAHGKPKKTLQLDYVYGYRCFMAQQNVFYTDIEDTIAYPAGALVVLLNKNSNTQTFLGGGELISAQGHSDDIVALTVNEDKTLLATGEVGTNPLICVWKLSEESGTEVKKLEQGPGTRAVAALCFSDDSKRLIAVDKAQVQTIRIYEWRESAVPLQTLLAGKGRVLSVRYSPKGSLFCTVGMEHFLFWGMKGHEFVKSKPGFNDPLVNMNVVQWFSNGNCVTGASDGKLYLWIEKNLKNKYQVLEPGCEILALAIVNNVIVVGGAGLTVHMLNATFKEIEKFNVPDWVMSLDKNGDNVLCCTRNGIIQELSGNSRFVLMESHCEREVWSVAVSPNDWHIIVSAGDDNKIKSWDLIQRRCVSTCILEAAEVQRVHRVSSLPQSQQSRAISISCKGHVAVAHNNGRISIRSNIHQLNLILKVLTEPGDWLMALQYSPKGSALAAGSQDTCIYVFDVSAGYSLFHRLGGLGPIVALDWSGDESRLRAGDESGRVMVWDVQAETREEEKDGMQWATWTSAKGQPVRGINQLSPDFSFVSCVTRSQDCKYFAVGNSWGLLEIYDNPNGPGSKANVYRGHALEIVNALWIRQDKILLTTGGTDLTMMQWKIVER